MSSISLNVHFVSIVIPVNSLLICKATKDAFIVTKQPREEEKTLHISEVFFLSSYFGTIVFFSLSGKISLHLLSGTASLHLDRFTIHILFVCKLSVYSKPN